MARFRAPSLPRHPSLPRGRDGVLGLPRARPGRLLPRRGRHRRARPGGTSSRRSCSPGSRARRMLGIRPRAAVGAFALGARRLRARLGPLLRVAGAHVGAARLARPLRAPRRSSSASPPMIGRERLTRQAAVRPDRDLRRRRPRRRRGGEPGRARDPDGARLGAAYAVYILLSDRLLRDADPIALAAYLTAGAATSFLVAGGADRVARHRRRPGRPRAVSAVPPSSAPSSPSAPSSRASGSSVPRPRRSSSRSRCPSRSRSPPSCSSST